MSTAALTNLRDYLYGTLTPDNMLWLSAQLAEHAKKQEAAEPYTKDELLARVEKSEQQFTNGQWQDFDAAMDELEKEFAEEDRILEVAE